MPRWRSGECVSTCVGMGEIEMKEQLVRFWKDEEGVTTLEYALVAAVLVVGIGVAVEVLTDGLSDAFTAITGKLAAETQ